jgi:HAD superfamily phosphoserine phosphatase-like hydrolase
VSASAGSPDDRTPPPRGAVVFDVDGVIFRGQLCFELSRLKGLGTYGAMLRDGFRYNRGRLPLEDLIGQGYRRLAGLPLAAVEGVFCGMRRTRGAREAIAELKAHGFELVLLSSGVPDHLVNLLVAELGADRGAGIEVGVAEEKLTGDVAGTLIRTDGKVEVVRRYLKERGLAWGQVVVVGDDDSNLGLMARAGTSIGIHATMGVRRAADYLAERDNLLSVVPLIMTERVPAPRPMATAEIVRRAVHMTAFAWPFVAHASLAAAVALLGTAAVFYAASEGFRLNGRAFPAFSWFTRLTIREPERRRFVAAPITLAAGVAASLFFPEPVPYLAVALVAFADPCAGIVGQICGRHKLPYSPRKSYEGLAAGLLVGCALCLVFLPPERAIIVAAAAAFVESLPLGDWDNLAVPLTAAPLAWLLLGG